MSDKKIISICIPTYNGEKTIGHTLDCIIKNVERSNELKEELEIVLTDDCSNDNTLEVINGYVNNYKYIKIFLNQKNLGMDLNFKQSALNCSGDYVWFSGQDDVFLEDSVDHVFRLLKENPEAGIVNVNFFQYSEEKEKIVCESMFHLQANNPKEIDFKRDLFFSSGADYFKFFNDAPSFLPSIVMKREFWLSTDVQKYNGTYFIQYALVLLSMKECKIIAVTKPLIRGLIPSGGWQKNGQKLFDIHLGFIKAGTMVFRDERNPFPSRVFERKKFNFLRHFIRMSFASTRYGFKLSDQDRDDLKFIYGSPIYYLYFYPILCLIGILPRPLVKLVFSFKKKIIG